MPYSINDIQSQLINVLVQEEDRRRASVEDAEGRGETEGGDEEEGRMAEVTLLYSHCVPQFIPM